MPRSRKVSSRLIAVHLSAGSSARRPPVFKLHPAYSALDSEFTEISDATWEAVKTILCRRQRSIPQIYHEISGEKCRPFVLRGHSNYFLKIPGSSAIDISHSIALAKPSAHRGFKNSEVGLMYSSQQMYQWVVTETSRKREREKSDQNAEPHCTCTPLHPKNLSYAAQ
ncbi:hypothetical protein VTK73DRAFT_2472 [Phialemonium thermophilum]|uniref:Uncharacterized protein n=1 Tax=Phialemonium thermophilum TaxID=223376 RepID=A0ABR3Y1Z1_9PEZI